MTGFTKRGVQRKRQEHQLRSFPLAQRPCVTYPSCVSVINPLAREISAKIVFYGPGLSGKTTSLQFIHDNLKTGQKGDLISLATEGDRTLYFDFLPIQLGRIRDLNLRLQLYTVPGQVFYGATRQLVLEGADGVVFVADSQNSAQERNVESLRDLENNLAKMGTTLSEIALVIQYNKRDLPDCDSVDELRSLLNKYQAPDYPTCAASGEGVLDALKTITRLVMVRLSKQGAADNPLPSLRRPLTPPTSLRPSDAEVEEFQTQVSHALETLDESHLRHAEPARAEPKYARQEQDEGASFLNPSIPPLPQAPSLTDFGQSNRPTAHRPQQSSVREDPVSPLGAVERGQKNNALTIQAPATSPLSFAALWDDNSEITKIEEDIAGGYFAEAVYRATGQVSQVLDNLLGAHSPETSATRAQLLGLDGHEYLELRRLGSRPASTITQRDALFALYVLIAAHLKESRLLR